MTQDILTCAIDRWMLIWGDPVLSGAVSMVAYGVAAVLAFRVARRQTDGQTNGQADGQTDGARPDDRALWRLCAWVLLFQVANTHLDLHAFPGSLGRCMAHAQGWYGQRATVQLTAFAVVAVAVCGLLLWVLIRYRAAIWSNLLLATGMVLSLGFTLVRGISLHAFAPFYSGNLASIPVSALIEMSGVALVILAAGLRLGSAKRRASQGGRRNISPKI